MYVVLAVAINACSLQRNFCYGLRLVAGMTIETAMRPIQNVSGFLIVVEAPAGPTVGIVTRCAVAREAAFMMSISMAIHAGARRILERRRAMAFLARHDGVTPDKRESRDIVIECDLLSPTRFFMALFAAISELSLVRIVLLVTRGAVCGDFITIKIAGVTGIAFDLAVLAPQRKFCHTIVVETYRLPFRGCMACLAFGSVSTGVSVLQTMTGHAGCW